ncbi:hypothetical protein ARC23_01250 [Stenotrophomonas beteli]|uniref:Uncharacterized protein n=1 Tax=Stenotrophomonas beteli TaxID=3384461 RepID=A0A0R0BAW0_9GAMM|nr:hypothetical protein ARC23_01250 [Stenotrophomonas maltophilia]
MRMSARTVNSFVKIFTQLNEKVGGHGFRGLQPREVVGTRTQFLRGEHAQLRGDIRQLRQQHMHRSGGRQPVVFHQHRLCAAMHARHLRIKVFVHAGRGIVVVQAHPRPVGNQPARLGATEAEATAMQHALTLRDPRQEAIDQRQQPAARGREAAPER